MKFKWFAVITIFSLLVLALIGCGSSQTSEQNREGVSQTTQVKTVKLAFEGPMTGNYAAFGEDMFRGFKMAVEEINAAGGFQAGPLKGSKIEIAGPFDDRGDPTEAANIAQKVVNDKGIFAYVGPGNSSCANAAYPVLSRANLTIINPYCTDPKLTRLGFKTHFRILLDNDVQSEEIARYLVEVFGKKNLAMVYSNNDYGRTIAETCRTAAEKLGANIAVDYGFTPGNTDYSVLVTQMKNKKVDGIALLCEYTDAALILKQSKAAGMDVNKSIPAVCAAGNNFPEFMEIGGEATEGTLLLTTWAMRLDNPLIKDFVGKFQDKYGCFPSECASYTYDAVKLIQKAVETGADSRENLANYVRQIKDFVGVSGKIAFDENGQAINKKADLLVVKNREFVPY